MGVRTGDLPATHVQNPHYITHLFLLVQHLFKLGAYNGVEIVFSGHRWSPHLGTGVNLKSDSLGGIQLRVGRKPYKYLISLLSILAGWTGMEDGLGVYLTFFNENGPFEWQHHCLKPQLFHIFHLRSRVSGSQIPSRSILFSKPALPEFGLLANFPGFWHRSWRKKSRSEIVPFQTVLPN